MNDRFKFRAWDKRQKTMRGVMQIDFRKDTELRRINATESPENWEPLLCNMEMYEDEFILMQCTGLKDKNGKLIFEGDIVHLEECDYQDRTEIGKQFATYESKIIEFDDGAFKFDGIPLADLLHNPYLSSEIIGNIYENPELLTPHPTEK